MGESLVAPEKEFRQIAARIQEKADQGFEVEL
jgi:hypothetical protein